MEPPREVCPLTISRRVEYRPAHLAANDAISRAYLPQRGEETLVCLPILLVIVGKAMHNQDCHFSTVQSRFHTVATVRCSS